MMRDQVTAFAGAGASAQQQLMEAKQQELEHVRAEASANNDRFVDGMKTTISAVGKMGTYVPVQPAGNPPASSGRPRTEAETKAIPGRQPTCPHCGKPVEAGAAFCEECGGSL